MLKFRKCAALLFAVLFTLSLAACGGTANRKEDSLLKARFTALYKSDTLAQMLADPQQYKDEIAAYGLDDFAATFADANAYCSYNAEVKVQNGHDFDIQMLNVQTEPAKQGKNGVWFSPLNDVQMGYPAQYSGDEALYYAVIADASMSTQDVLKTLGEMGISFVYMKGSDAPEMDDQIDPSNLFTGDILYEG